MSRLTLSIAAVLWFGTATSQTLPTAQDTEINSEGHEVSSTTVLIKLRESSMLAADASAALGNMGVVSIEPLELVPGLYVATISPGPGIDSTTEALAASPAIEYVQPDYVLRKFDSVAVDDPGTSGEIDALAAPNDPLYWSQWGLENIRAPSAWNIATRFWTDGIIAVIDSGVQFTHPDLARARYVNTGEIPGNRVDDDRNGFIDDVSGWDFVQNDADSGDCDGHGTHVAGTIAAAGNNGIGVSGVMWDARILSVRFLDCNGAGFTSNAIKALNYAVRMKARVSNNSWGGGAYDAGLYGAISAAAATGHVFVAAAGNGGSDGIGDNNDAVPAYPASYNLGNILSVASIHSGDGRSYFSNFGPNSVDLAAPGSSILSTTMGGGYQSWSGTSMAAPHVTGVVAMLLKRKPSWSYQLIVEAVLKTTRQVPGLSGTMRTGGTLDASQAARYKKPAAPGSVSLATASTNSIVVNWKGKANSVGYYIERASAGSNLVPDCSTLVYTRVATVAAPLISQDVPHAGMVSGLAAKTTYCIRMQGYNSVGASIYTKPKYVRTL